MKAGWLLLAILIGGCSSPKPGEHACTGAAALTSTTPTAIDGTSLPAKTLSLTFDDGPATRTLELSAYLKGEGIRAVFFQNGRNFGPKLDPAVVIPQLLADGHLVGNHTQDHKDLAKAFATGPDGDAAIVKELADTDAILAPFVGSTFLFRAPFGSFDERALTTLQGSAMNKYVGTINWDIGGVFTGPDASGYGADWDCWQHQSSSSKKCGDRYLHQVHDVGRGVILMHDADYGDNTNHGIWSGKGNTVDMVKYLVPLLKGAGYTFVRLDEVPVIAAMLVPANAPPSPASVVASPPTTVGAPLETAGPSLASAPLPCR